MENNYEDQIADIINAIRNVNGRKDAAIAQDGTMNVDSKDGNSDESSIKLADIYGCLL